MNPVFKQLIIDTVKEAPSRPGEIFRSKYRRAQTDEEREIIQDAYEFWVRMPSAYAFNVQAVTDWLEAH